MKEKSQQSATNSLEVQEKLSPFMPFLLKDLWALGSSVEQILCLIGTLPLPSCSAKVSDLGCGKGAVSVRTASEFGFSVVGIDAMPEFLEDAHRKAIEYQVSDLCTFIEQDIHTYVADKHDFDIVILASLGGIFGNYTNMVRKLSTQIRPGGYIIIDDGYLKKKEFLNRKGYGRYRNYENTLQELTAFNHHLFTEISTSEVSRKINDEYLKVIENRSAELIAQHPELEKDLKKFLNIQREECDILNCEVEGIIWVLQDTAGQSVNF